MLQLIAWGVAVGLTYLLVDWYRRQPRLTGMGQRYILITGCDSGFGNILAKRLDGLGCHVFAACLTEQGQKELRNSCTPRLKTVIMDVTDKDSVCRAFDFVLNLLPTGYGLWGLVNNAGIGGVTMGPIEWLVAEDFRRTFEVNTLGLIDVTLTFLPLLKRARGRIVNMSSSAGRLAGPHALPYSVSKFGVEAFSDGLRQHLKMGSYDVSVHVVEPGLFRTDITTEERMSKMLDHAWKRLPSSTQQEFGESFPKQYLSKFMAVMHSMASPDLNKVVDAYAHALTAVSPRMRYSVGLDGTFTIYLSYLPMKFVDWFVGKVTNIKIRPQNRRR